MGNVGLTADGAALLLNYLCSQPLTFAPHIGEPGAEGTENPSVVTARVAVTMSVTGPGEVTLVSAARPLIATAEEIWTHGSVWSGFDGDPSAICVLTGVAKPAKRVVLDDTVNVAGITLTLPGLASD